MRRTLLLTLCLAPATIAAALESFTIDAARSTVAFCVPCLGISETCGTFRDVAGSIDLDPQAPEHSRVDATIAAVSIDTEREDRDAHLRDDRFLDVARFPEIHFTSERVARQPDGAWTIDGSLALHGVTRPITLTIMDAPPVEGVAAANALEATATATLDRHDFGIDYHGMSIGAQVTITLRIHARRTPAPPDGSSVHGAPAPDPRAARLPGPPPSP